MIRSNRGSGDVAPVAEIATSCVRQGVGAHEDLIREARNLAEQRITLTCSVLDPFGPPDERHSLAAACPSCPIFDLCREAGRGEFGVWGGVDHGLGTVPLTHEVCVSGAITQTPDPVSPRPTSRQREGVKK